MSSEIKARYAAIIAQASVSDIAAAATWYSKAQAIASELSITSGHSLEVTASVISAFSPRCPWSRNVFLATEFLNGRNVATLGNNIRAANRALEVGFDALNGAKTNAFARNIAGDLSAVTIDTWMIKAAGMDNKKGVNKSQYKLLAGIITELAEEHGIAPAQLQALIWIVVRGGAE